jgi:hypothetical protein
MQIPLFMRSLTVDEQTTLEAGLRSLEASTVRSCQQLLANDWGQHTIMARTLRCHDQTVRPAIHGFHRLGVAGPSGPPPWPDEGSQTVTHAALSTAYVICGESSLSAYSFNYRQSAVLPGQKRKDYVSSTWLSTNSITAIAAASPGRYPRRRIRV